MLTRIRRWAQFQLERFLLGGAVYRLLFIVGCLGILSVGCGLLLTWVERGEAHLEPAESIWWAFLRLTDPGYLGDDQGGARRVISTILTILGYVLFLGALVATMTQGLNDQIRRLERGFTPVAMKNHIVILGWSAATPELVSELTQSERGMRGFLERHGLKGMRLAVLAEEVGPELEQALREHLGQNYNRAITVLRSGSALQAAHLERVDFRNAAAVVFSPPETSRDVDEASDDAQLAKAVVTLRRQLRDQEHAPIVIASVTDPLKLALVRRSYRPGRTQLVSGTLIVARLMVRFIRYPGLATVIGEILSTADGSELYLHPCQEDWPREPAELARSLPGATLFGFLSQPPKDRETRFPGAGRFRVAAGNLMRADDQLVVLAKDSTLDFQPSEQPSEWGQDLEPLTIPELEERHHTLLMIGWNDRSPWFLAELERAQGEVWRVLVVSSALIKDREAQLVQAGVHLKRLTLEHRHAEVTIVRELESLPLLDFEAVMVMSNDRLESAEDADARTLLIHQLLRARFRDLGAPHWRILVELRDPSNEGLFDRVDTEVVPSSVLVTHVLAQVALRPELRPVLDALLDEHGPEIELHPVSDCGLEGQCLTFGELVARGVAGGITVLGVRVSDRNKAPRIHLNLPHDEKLVFGDSEELVTLVDRRDGGRRSSEQPPPARVPSYL